MNIFLITFRWATKPKAAVVAFFDADSPAANEQKSEQRYKTAFVSLPYRRRFFHSFEEARRTEKIPGSVFQLTGRMKNGLLFLGSSLAPTRPEVIADNLLQTQQCGKCSLCVKTLEEFHHVRNLNQSMIPFMCFTTFTTHPEFRLWSVTFHLFSLCPRWYLGLDFAHSKHRLLHSIHVKHSLQIYIL